MSNSKCHSIKGSPLLIGGMITTSTRMTRMCSRESSLICSKSLTSWMASMILWPTSTIRWWIKTIGSSSKTKRSTRRSPTSRRTFSNSIRARLCHRHQGARKIQRSQRPNRLEGRKPRLWNLSARTLPKWPSSKLAGIRTSAKSILYIRTCS